MGVCARAAGFRAKKFPSAVMRKANVQAQPMLLQFNRDQFARELLASRYKWNYSHKVQAGEWLEAKGNWIC
jgi:hypothetical protein